MAATPLKNFDFDFEIYDIKTDDFRKMIIEEV